MSGSIQVWCIVLVTDITVDGSAPLFSFFFLGLRLDKELGLESYACAADAELEGPVCVLQDGSAPVNTMVGSEPPGSLPAWKYFCLVADEANSKS